MHGTTLKIKINLLKAELNPICHLLAVLAHLIFHVSRIRDNVLQLRILTNTFNTLRTRSFKLFKRPFPGFLTILTL